MTLQNASDEELVDELERRSIVDERLLRGCGPNTIAAELMWRASKPRDVRSSSPDGGTCVSRRAGTDPR